MTVEKLREALEGLDSNLKVYLYLDETEDGASISSVRLTGEFPYCKADAPKDLPEEFVLLKGWSGM